MSMKLFSAKLLEKEIKKLEELGLEGERQLLHDIFTKELEVINKIKIDAIDARGGIEEFKNLISNQSIYFIKPEEYVEMKRKSQIFDEIRRAVNGG